MNDWDTYNICALRACDACGAGNVDSRRRSMQHCGQLWSVALDGGEWLGPLVVNLMRRR